LSVFANQHGLPKEIHGPLLEQVISNAASSKFYKEDEDWDHDFSSIHDKIQSFFVKKATEFMDGFFKSPAGVAYLKEYESVRSVLHLLEIYSDYRRTKKGPLAEMHQLTAADISKFVWEGKEYEGIQMSTAEIFEYWEPVVLLSSAQLFVLSFSISNLIVASS